MKKNMATPPSGGKKLFGGRKEGADLDFPNHKKERGSPLSERKPISRGEKKVKHLP